MSFSACVLFLKKNIRKMGDKGRVAKGGIFTKSFSSDLSPSEKIFWEALGAEANLEHDALRQHCKGVEARMERIAEKIDQIPDMAPFLDGEITNNPQLIQLEHIQRALRESRAKIAALEQALAAIRKENIALRKRSEGNILLPQLTMAALGGGSPVPLASPRSAGPFGPSGSAAYHELSPEPPAHLDQPPTTSPSAEPHRVAAGMSEQPQQRLPPFARGSSGFQAARGSAPPQGALRPAPMATRPGGGAGSAPATRAAVPRREKTAASPGGSAAASPTAASPIGEEEAEEAGGMETSAASQSPLGGRQVGSSGQTDEAGGMQTKPPRPSAAGTQLVGSSGQRPPASAGAAAALARESMTVSPEPAVSPPPSLASVPPTDEPPPRPQQQQQRLSGQGQGSPPRRGGNLGVGPARASAGRRVSVPLVRRASDSAAAVAPPGGIATSENRSPRAAGAHRAGRKELLVPAKADLALPASVDASLGTAGLLTSAAQALLEELPALGVSQGNPIVTGAPAGDPKGAGTEASSLAVEGAGGMLLPGAVGTGDVEADLLLAREAALTLATQLRACRGALNGTQSLLNYLCAVFVAYQRRLLAALRHAAPPGLLSTRVTTSLGALAAGKPLPPLPAKLSADRLLGVGTGAGAMDLALFGRAAGAGTHLRPPHASQDMVEVVHALEEITSEEFFGTLAHQLEVAAPPPVSPVRSSLRLSGGTVSATQAMLAKAGPPARAESNPAENRARAEGFLTHMKLLGRTTAEAITKWVAFADDGNAAVQALLANMPLAAIEAASTTGGHSHTTGPGPDSARSSSGATLPAGAQSPGRPGEEETTGGGGLVVVPLQHPGGKRGADEILAQCTSVRRKKGGSCTDLIASLIDFGIYKTFLIGHRIFHRFEFLVLFGLVLHHKGSNLAFERVPIDTEILAQDERLREASARVTLERLVEGVKWHQFRTELSRAPNAGGAANRSVSDKLDNALHKLETRHKKFLQDWAECRRAVEQERTSNLERAVDTLRSLEGVVRQILAKGAVVTVPRPLEPESPRGATSYKQGLYSLEFLTRFVSTTSLPRLLRHSRLHPAFISPTLQPTPTPGPQEAGTDAAPTPHSPTGGESAMQPTVTSAAASTSPGGTAPLQPADGMGAVDPTAAPTQQPPLARALSPPQTSQSMARITLSADLNPVMPLTAISYSSALLHLPQNALLPILKSPRAPAGPPPAAAASPLLAAAAPTRPPAGSLLVNPRDAPILETPTGLAGPAQHGKPPSLALSPQAAQHAHPPAAASGSAGAVTWPLTQPAMQALRTNFQQLVPALERLFVRMVGAPMPGPFQTQLFHRLSESRAAGLSPARSSTTAKAPYFSRPAQGQLHTAGQQQGTVTTTAGDLTGELWAEAVTILVNMAKSLQPLPSLAPSAASPAGVTSTGPRSEAPPADVEPQLLPSGEPHSERSDRAAEERRWVAPPDPHRRPALPPSPLLYSSTVKLPASTQLNNK
ncbi:hypothetical protein PAPYR_6998 [Paratrimastix pyriformis]|uniref:Uncharacterized protein n=1 Tax=Paratrimastix pyriformis TaxID=342808 RepID=A0ABQ8UGH4_9EUKA|nr:hypothetical protein PAPYR_6998 [Paratrimastix pyriformis]